MRVGRSGGGAGERCQVLHCNRTSSRRSRTRRSGVMDASVVSSSVRLPRLFAERAASTAPTISHMAQVRRHRSTPLDGSCGRCRSRRRADHDRRRSREGRLLDDQCVAPALLDPAAAEEGGCSWISPRSAQLLMGSATSGLPDVRRFLSASSPPLRAPRRRRSRSAVSAIAWRASRVFSRGAARGSIKLTNHPDQGGEQREKMKHSHRLSVARNALHLRTWLCRYPFS